MNRDDIINMARKAGIDAEKDTLCRFEGWVEPIERFAQAAYAAGGAAEKEACAQLTEQMGIEGYGTLAIAAAIRARGAGMNREDIIRMAREADGHHDALERFAALVEQEFKERLAQAIEQLPFGDTAQSFATYVREFK